MIVRPILIKKLIDKVLDTQSWISWEPETLERELSHAGIPEIGYYKKNELFTNIIDAIRAILSPDSMALMEWPIFENVCVTFSGNPPDFYETTPPSPAQLYFAIRFLEDFFSDLLSELSDETLMYIGSLYITDGILCHLHPVINNAILFTARHSNLDIEKDRQEQEGILKKLGENKKLIKALSTSVVSGGEDLGMTDKASIESRRAIQILVSFLFIENQFANSNKILKDFLTNLKETLPKPIIDNLDSERANVTDEHVADVDEISADELIDTLGDAETASLGETAPGYEVEIKEVSAKKEAEALPGIAGMNYHAGQLYNVINEIGHDDVPKSKLLSNDAKGNVILKGNTEKSFSNDGNALHVMTEKKPKKQTESISSPADSSLELAEV